MSLVIDNREKEPTVATLLRILGPTPVERLDSADFAFADKCGHTLGIERKTGSDLLGSLTKKQNGTSHMIDQLNRMKVQYDYSALLIEGGVACEPGTLKAMPMPTGRVSGWWYAAVEMLLLRFQREGHLRFQTPNLYSTAHLVRTLRDRSARGCFLPSLPTIESETNDVSD